MRAPIAPAPKAPVAPPAPAQAVSGRIDDIHRMVEALLDLQAKTTRRADLPPTLQAYLGHLLRQEVEEELARALMNQVRNELTGTELTDKQAVRQRLTELICKRISVGGPIKRDNGRHSRVISLIGPTGVGKTTTIAKLAANLKLKEGKSVGLITIDTYRIAAVDQLKTYAQIIDVPLRVVLSGGELRQAIAAMSGLDVVLIDTAGRSQNDHMRLNQLREFISAAAADEVHLVVAATAARANVRASIDRFCPLGVSHIILSKLDEAGAFGTILNVAEARKAAFSYITTGQDVPDDIALADSSRLASCIVRGSLYAS